MKVDEDLRIPFGRFDHGKPKDVAAGEYLYVGSALNNLGTRSIKHATRLGDHSPHRIRETLLTELPRQGWAANTLEPRIKKPFYNVDHLLDQLVTSLLGVYLVRVPERAEASIGKFLEMDNATHVFEKDLGANDIPGNTHLLRVEADEEWWNALPKRLLTVANLAAVHGDSVMHAALVGVQRAGWRLTDKQLGSLTRMWPERAANILHRLERGIPYTRANRESQGVYDTTGYGEVVSRLARARGSVLRTLGIIRARGDDVIETTQQRLAIRVLARQARESSESLLRTIVKTAGPSGQKLDEPEAHDPGKPVTFNQLAGKLRQCVKFLDKNRRDVPLIGKKVGIPATSKQRDRIRAELKWIAEVANDIASICHAN